jgi:hypothetical protein
VRVLFLAVVRREVEVTTPFVCSECQVTFNDASDLAGHIKLVHVDARRQPSSEEWRQLALDLFHLADIEADPVLAGVCLVYASQAMTIARRKTQ